MYKAKIRVEEKVFYNQNIMKIQRGLKRRLAHNLPEKKRKKEYSVVYKSFSHSSCQVLLLCVVASNLFASTKIYLLLNQNRKKMKKKEKSLSMVGVSVDRLLGSMWVRGEVDTLPFFFSVSSLCGKSNRIESDRLL